MEVNKKMTPTIENMNQLDAAVLMTKQLYILGMLNYGTSEQKARAKKELCDIESLLKQHLNTPAMNTAIRNLGFTDEELKAIEESLISD